MSKVIEWKATNISRDADGKIESIAYQCDAYDPEVLNHKSVPHRGIAHGLCRFDNALEASTYNGLTEDTAVDYVQLKLSLAPGGVEAIEAYAKRRCDKLINREARQGTPW